MIFKEKEMLVNFQTILKDADEKGYAVPAFNVYNMETVMGVIKAAEEKRAPVIIQFYSRLATTGFSDYLAPIILKAAEMATVPVCMHLDHGAGFEAAAIALKNGATGIMVDFSKLSMEENIENTKKAVDILSVMNIGVEGETFTIGVWLSMVIRFMMRSTSFMWFDGSFQRSRKQKSLKPTSPNGSGTVINRFCKTHMPRQNGARSISC